MKKILSFLFIVLLGYAGYTLYNKYFANRIPILDVENEMVSLDKLFIYGTNLNLHGNSIDDDNLDLVLYNGQFIAYHINNNGSDFNISDEINNGINLEKIPIGTYYAFLRSSSKDEDGNDIFRYYAIKNETDYKTTTYYTFSNVNNKIVIDTDDYYETLSFYVNNNKDSDVYDIIIDPGHGGIDSGATKNGKNEADYAMKIANKLRKKMEENGIKVKLTREDGQLGSNEKLDDYGPHGRAVINHEVNAKYVFSIHLNSNSASYVHGVEVYTADNINYNLANNIAKNIVNMAETNYSTNRINKVSDGVYTRTFTESDIKSSFEEYENKNMKPYNITTNSNYYFMIRETGGIMTGAYVDDRNPNRNPGNPYYNSNVGSEAYLLELGYLTNSNDIYNIDKNMDKYIDAMVTSFLPVFNEQ